jgi:hypothetical protein
MEVLLGKFRSIGEDDTEVYLTETQCDFVWTLSKRDQ